eukprot:UN00704
MLTMSFSVCFYTPLFFILYLYLLFHSSPSFCFSSSCPPYLFLFLCMLCYSFPFFFVFLAQLAVSKRMGSISTYFLNRINPQNLNKNNNHLLYKIISIFC